MLKIGLVPYLNALPYRLAFETHPSPFFSLHTAVPSRLNRLFLEGELDCAFISSVHCIELPLSPLSSFGIGSFGPILSINLYLRRSIADLEGGLCALTPESETSCALLKELAHRVWGVTPRYTSFAWEDLERYEAVLLIGDSALKNRSLPGFRTLDLAKEWTLATGLPFIFALWSVKPEVYAKKKELVDLLAQEFDKALLRSTSSPENLAQEAHKRSGLPLEFMHAYYTLCRYRMGPEEFRGFNLFSNYVRSSISSLDPAAV